MYVLDWLVAHRLQAIVLIFWTVVIAAGQQYAIQENISLETLELLIREILQIAFWGPLLLIILYGVRPLTFIPSSLLTILAGSIFGIFPGIFYALLGGVVSALLPYGLGYWSSRTANTVHLGHKNNLLAYILEEVHDYPVQSVFISRLLYPPYDLVNFLFGTLRIPFLSFIAGTLTGNVIGAFGYLGIGASVEGTITSGNLNLNEELLLLSLLILVASLIIMLFLRRCARSLCQDGD